MSLMNKASAALVVGLLCVSSMVSRGDDYSRTANGSFSSTDWYNNTTNTPPPQGPPGSGDTAALNGYNVTANGGSVMTLGGGGMLAVTGSFKATTAMGFTLAGAGTFNATNNSFITVDGGHLSTKNDTGGHIAVSGGGAETALTIKTGSNGVISSGGSLSVAAGAIDFNFTLQTGGTADLTDLVNGQSVSVLIEDSGSALTVDDKFDVAAGFLDIKNGGKLTVKKSLNLDGMGNIGGGGHWQGAGTKVISTGTFILGDTAPLPSFALRVDSGATVSAEDAVIGNKASAVAMVALDGAGTAWTETSGGGLIIGEFGQGTMNLTGGAHLVGTGSAVIGVGDSSHSMGVLTADGSGTLISAGASGGFSVGISEDGTGSVTLTNGAKLTAARAFAIGIGGNGTFTARSGSKVTVSDKNGFLVGSQAGGSGYIDLEDTGTVLTASGPVTLGFEGSGGIGIGSGAKLVIPTGLQTPNLTLGDGEGSVGEMNVAGGTFDDDDFVQIGRRGSGIFNATFSASVHLLEFAAPASDGGQATIEVDNSDWVVDFIATLGTAKPGDPSSTLALKNSATMRISSDFSINQTGTVTIDDTSEMAIGSGSFSLGAPGSVVVTPGGVLAGSGNVIGKVINAGGQILPGFSPGILNITGSYQQTATGTYSAEIGGPDPGTGYDQIKVTGAATLGGTLACGWSKVSRPAVGQTFTLLTCDFEKRQLQNHCATEPGGNYPN